MNNVCKTCECCKTWHRWSEPLIHIDAEEILRNPPSQLVGLIATRVKQRTIPNPDRPVGERNYTWGFVLDRMKRNGKDDA